MWEKLNRWAKTLENDGLTLWFCCKHPQMPLLPKILALIVVAYFLSPIDLIPDFIPILGYVDDLILVPIGIYFILKLVPAPVLADCRTQAAAWIVAHQPTPRSIAGAIAIMGLWILLFAALWQCYGARIMQWFGAG